MKRREVRKLFARRVPGESRMGGKSASERERRRFLEGASQLSAVDHTIPSSSEAEEEFEATDAIE